MDQGVVALLIGVVCAVVLGYFTARASASRDAIHGGSLASAFHYIGAASVTGVFPVVLANVILGQGIVRALLSAALFFAVALVALVAYAALELPQRVQAEAGDQGWTKEDALTSNL
jgi:hypothetical protein